MNGDDEALLAELSEALAEPAGDDIADVGRAVWSWHDPDRALADLVRDSAGEPAAPAGVRGTTGTLRVLWFETADVTIEVELSDGRLRGLAVAPWAALIELHTADQDLVASADVDDTGWFELTLPAQLRGRATLVRLRLSGPDGTETWTAWFRT